jgi:hypothetical protein
MSDAPEVAGPASTTGQGPGWGVQADSALPPRLAGGPKKSRWSLWVLGVVVLVGVVTGMVVVVESHGATTTGPGGGTSAKVSTGSTTSSPSPSSTSTTTMAPYPPTRQRTAQAAADDLVGAWASSNRAQASAGATAAAVDALFAVPYPSGQAANRGCSDGAPPVTCSYGPPGGANPNAAIFLVEVSQAPDGGWYVSGVRVEG